MRWVIFLIGSMLSCKAGLTIEPVSGQRAFAWRNPELQDLSGITWTDGTKFWAVSDKQRVLVPLTIKLNLTTGGIEDVKSGVIVPVATRFSDFEGMAWNALDQKFYVSAEGGSGIVAVTASGKVQKSPVIPAIFSTARRNLSLESITWQGATRRYWIANEEALPCDGAVALAKTSSTVRLQEFDAAWKPLRQFAWRTEPPAFRMFNAGSGVSDLCLLPDGKLLVLERGFGTGGLVCRIFLAGFDKATLTGNLSFLTSGAAFMPVAKTLLFERATGLVNYEGLALGPALQNGDRSLVILADSNSGATHHFVALRLTGFKPAR